MSQTEQISGVDLTGDEYQAVQHLVRNKYKVYDESGTQILKAKQKLFKMKEEFPFETPEGEPVFTIKAQGIMDFAGDYTLLEADTEDPIAVLEKEFTFLKHVWRIRDPDSGDVYAVIESGSVVVELLRNLSAVFSLLPHSYTVETPDGDSLGSIEGKLSLKDTYDITIDDTGGAPKEALVAAAIAIDALEGN